MENVERTCLPSVERNPVQMREYLKIIGLDFWRIHPNGRNSNKTNQPNPKAVLINIKRNSAHSARDKSFIHAEPADDRRINYGKT